MIDALRFGRFASKNGNGIGAIAKRSIAYMESLKGSGTGAEGPYWNYLKAIVPDWPDHVDDGSSLRFKLVELYGGGWMKASDYDAFAKLSRQEQEKLPFIERYRKVCADIPTRFHLSEPIFARAPKQWGVSIDGKQLSWDVMRFQCFVASMFKLGLLPLEGQTALEIGSGGGLLACHIAAVANPKRYICVDIPHTLYCAAAVCRETMPDKRIFIFDPADHLNTKFADIADEYDLFFIPSYMMELVYGAAPIHLAINTWSMQEMTETQVDHYCAMLHHCLDGTFYSCNIPRHPHNYWLKSRLFEFFERYFTVLPRENPIPEAAWSDHTHVCTSPKRARPLRSGVSVYNIQSADQRIV